MGSTTCRICGRRLTNPVSVEREIGPTCLARLRRREANAEGERRLRAMSVDEMLDGIAVNVSLSDHGDFLKTFAKAWQMADPFNKRILKPAFLVLIEKYRLDKEYEPTQVAEADP